MVDDPSRGTERHIGSQLGRTSDRRPQALFAARRDEEARRVIDRELQRRRHKPEHTVRATLDERAAIRPDERKVLVPGEQPGEPQHRVDRPAASMSSTKRQRGNSSPAAAATTAAPAPDLPTPTSSAPLGWAWAARRRSRSQSSVARGRAPLPQPMTAPSPSPPVNRRNTRMLDSSRRRHPRLERP